MAKYSESIEGKLTTLECMNCGHREVFSERQFKTVDGYSCEKCEGPVNAALTEPGEEVRNRRMSQKPPAPPTRSRKKNDALSINVDVDVTDALKGLKAIQREAKKTIQLLKEVESAVIKEKPRLKSAHYECVLCKHSEFLRSEDKNYSEVLVCPKCKGAFVDSWYKHKHIRPEKE